VMRALSKDHDARQQSLAEFLDSLAEAAGNAGLLNDARALLFGTIWGEDLAAPGSYLSDLLGASAPPSSSASPLAATQAVPVARDPDDDALLSAAPKPFGTTSHDLAAVPERKKRKYGWLWAALALMALLFAGVVAGNWWTHREPRAVAAEPVVEPVPNAVAATPAVDAAVADVGTDVLLDETPVLEEVEPEPPVVEEEQVEEAPPVPAPKPKPKKKRAKKKRPAPALSPAPAPTPAPAPAPTPALEPDDGIDWTVPDFPSASAPDAPSPAAPEPDPAPPATPSEPRAPPEPPPPTGTPDAPARNPVVIDEPPSP
ncbi:MAG: hypothetical protein ACN4G0_03710, partial [Polyangiales bacterium]